LFLETTEYDVISVSTETTPKVRLIGK
jgi:hypothetical protein